MRTVLFSVFALACASPDSDKEKIVRYEAMPYQEVIKEISTPKEVAWYLENYIHKEESISFAHSFRVVHETRKGDCSEAIVAAGALLSDDAYPAHIVIFRSSDKEEKHGIFVYQENGLWGSLGINSFDIRNPQYKTIEELVKEFPYEKYLFSPFPLETSWISSSENLYVQGKYFLGIHGRYKEIHQ